jgi:peptidoglycan/LPS O-acetylase OafA/YrhL
MIFLHQATVFFANAIPFFVGAALAMTDLGSRRLWGLTAFLSILTVLSVSTPAFEPLLLLTLPIAVLLVARYGVCDLRRIGDFSYGAYLWGFVAQQAVMQVFPGLSPAGLFFAAAAVTLALSALSWHVVEKHALKLKPRVRNKRLVQ